MHLHRPRAQEASPEHGLAMEIAVEEGDQQIESPPYDRPMAKFSSFRGLKIISKGEVILFEQISITSHEILT